LSMLPRSSLKMFINKWVWRSLCWWATTSGNQWGPDMPRLAL
jgi:hypothetical protein